MVAVSGPANVRERIIVALDVPTTEEARAVVAELRGHAGAFKVGMQLFTAGGPAFVRELADSGVRIFLDLKFHDIPNTVANAGIEAAKLGVWMFNVHALGGRGMMQRTVETVRGYCSEEGVASPLIIGVTVLTSSGRDELSQIGIHAAVEEQVLRLARLSAECGLDGVVASSREVRAIRECVTGEGFIAVTPGIRGAGATPDDQQRVTSVGEALANGSDYVVIGRPILMAGDRKGALEKIVEEAERT